MGFDAEKDLLFNYIKLGADHFWIVLALAAIALVFLRPRVLGIIQSVKFPGIEVALRELKDELQDTKEQVEFLKARNDQLTKTLTDYDVNTSLAAQRTKFKGMAARLSESDMAVVREGFNPGASHERLFAAAEIARSRRDPAVFDELVACIDRIAQSPKLEGARLQIVWTLASALHKTLISEIQDREHPELSHAQLVAARHAIEKLVANPRVLADQPDTPSRGIRGPANNAYGWIERGLARLGEPN